MEKRDNPTDLLGHEIGLGDETARAFGDLGPIEFVRLLDSRPTNKVTISFDSCGQSGGTDLPVYPHQPVLRSVGFLQVRQIDIAPTNDGVAGPIEAGRITEVQLSANKETKGNEPM
jgi:hypothetical protein